LANLPLGVRATSAGRHLCTRIGEYVLDLHDLVPAVLDPDLAAALQKGSLNAFLSSGPQAWTTLRRRLVELLTDDTARPTVEPHLLTADAVTLQLPFEVADYVDFYSSEQHAKNVSDIFGAGSPYLPEHWYHMPIAYHGRAGTVVVSGTPVHRPWGQRRRPDERNPTFGPSRRLDIEAEVGFVVGVPSKAGSALRPEQLADHVFGVVLVNDWSARDLQAWESAPLGPFLGKSFATSISAWVVPLEALRAARRPIRTQSPAVLPYLHDVESWCLDLALQIHINGALVSEPPFATHYWSPGQQLAHLTAGGAPLRTGDLFASGTVTGPGRHERGSLLELTWGGREPITLSDGTERGFLEDGDVVTISATAPDAMGGRLSLGEVVGRVVPGER
jgi:fumarylacetoacetase